MMETFTFRRCGLLAGWMALGVLAGCGGGDSAQQITGLAATGAGIANGTVTARCVAGPELTGTTDSGGSYTLTLATNNQLPCMVQVVGGTPTVTLYSFAQTAGRVNITPATDLIVASALGADPGTQFGVFDATQGGAIASNLTAAIAYVNNQLGAIVGASLGSDPLIGTFSVGDADDRLLDALGAAMAAGGKTIADLRPAAMAESSLATTDLVPPYLGVPQNPVATANSASQITLTWTAVPGATGYKVYRAASTGTVDVAGTPVGAPSGASFADTGLAASTAYFYKVVATNAVLPAGGNASPEASATTSAASGGGSGSGGGGLTCDTTKFAEGAGVSSPTTQQVGTFAKTYQGSEGEYGMDSSFTASGSATLVLNSNGTASYNGQTLTLTSYCLETLPNNAGSQLVIHAGDMTHFDLWPTGEWSGYTAAGKAVSDQPYVSSVTSYGSLTVTGTASGIQGAVVPSSFAPTATGSHPTAKVSWSIQNGSSPWYITLSGDSAASTAGFGSWSKTVVLTGLESIGISYDMPNGKITFTNVKLPAFSIGQTGEMILNGTLNLPAVTGTAVTFSDTGADAAGSGLDGGIPAMTTNTVGTTVIDTYMWNADKVVSVELKVYSSGSKALTVKNAAGPSWQSTNLGTTVVVDKTAKTVTFNNASLGGVSPTTSTLKLNGTLSLP